MGERGGYDNEGSAPAPDSAFWQGVERQTQAAFPGFAPPADKAALQAEQSSALQRLAQEQRKSMPTIAHTDAYTRQEVVLGLRNHGLHLEGLRYPVTPVGMHYVLIHFDIPTLDAATYEVTLGGAVQRPLRLALDDVRRRPRVTIPVHMECGGVARDKLSPRPIVWPWKDEACGCAEWTGTPLRPLLEEAGLADDVVEILFTGRDRGFDQGIEHVYERSLPLAEALRDEVLLAYEVNGMPLPPQHGFPLRLIVPGWYGMTSVKWLKGITALTAPFRGVQRGSSTATSAPRTTRGSRSRARTRTP